MEKKKTKITKNKSKDAQKNIEIERTFLENVTCEN